MIALTPPVRVLVAVAPPDFRCGIDGLARRVRQALAQDPFGGAVFVFRNRRGTAIKLLAYDLGEAPRYVELTEATGPSSAFSLASNAVELHIMQPPSEGLQPGQYGCVGAPRGEGRIGTFPEGTGPFEGLTFGLEVDSRVSIGRFNARMTEPVADGDGVNATAA